MENFVNSLLVLHIAFGSIALLSGLISMLTKKGAAKHRNSGKIFFWSMFGILTTALMLAVIRPNMFLFLVGIFSFYFAFTGYRILYISKKQIKPELIDWLVTVITAVASVAMLVGGFINLQTFRTQFNPILLVFGIAGIMFAGRDLSKFINKPALKSPQDYLYHHIGRMSGAYIATFTAFVVVNVNFLPAVVVWLTPGVVGSILISYTIKKYRRKFEKPKIAA